MGDDDDVFPDVMADTPLSDAPQADTSPSVEPSITSGSKTKTKKHRLAASIDVMQTMAERVGDVASSISKLREEIVDKDALLQALLELQGILSLSTSQVSDVFDMLVQHDKLAIGFLARPIELRKAWIVDFIMKQFGGRSSP